MSHSICENIKQIQQEIGNTQLVVVSKYRSLSELQEVYDCGHRDFGENRVQEVVSKESELPKDIRWHIIGHLQTNKVKYIIPFVHLIHSIDSLKLLKEVNKQAKRVNRTVDVLLQIKIAQEDTKYGFSITELSELLENLDFKTLTNITCKGLMGMATNTEDSLIVDTEFKKLASVYSSYQESHQWSILSMGMSSDYKAAIKEGSSMLRIGSKVFT